MPVPSKMADLFTIAASNSPAGSDLIGNSLDDYLRAAYAILRSTNALASASIAAASTTDLSTADAESVQITGAATINSLGTVSPGIVRECRFTGVCTLVNSAAIALPGTSNITTSAGDVIRFRSLGSGNWVMVDALISYGYLPLSGGTLTGAITGTTISANSVVATGNQFTGGASLAILNTSAASGQVILRPNGPASTTGQLSLDASGNMTVATSNSQAFISTNTTAVLAASAASGQVLLRPNGNGSSTGQVVVDSSGNVSAPGTVTVGTLTSSNNVNANTNFLSTNTFWLAAPSAAGTFFFRPNGSGSTTNQTQMGSNGIWQGIDFQSISDERLKEMIGPMQSGYAELKQLKPMHYLKYGDLEHSGDGHEEVGFIAQQVRDVLPSAVMEGDFLTVSPMQLIALVANAVIQIGAALEKKGIL